MNFMLKGFASDVNTTYRRIASFLYPYRKRLTIGLFCMVGAALFGVLPPWLIKNLVDDVLMRGDMFMLNLIITGVIALYVIKGVFSYSQLYLMTWVGQRVILDIRTALYERTQRLPFSYIYKRRMGELISRITNDVSVLQDVVSSVVVDMVIQGATFIGILGFLFFLNWKLTIATFAILPVAAYAVGVASKQLRSVGHATQEQLAQVSAAAQEALASLRIVRAFATEDLEHRRFSEKSKSHFKELMRGTQIKGVLEAVVEIILISAMCLIIWMGGRDVVTEALTPGELLAFLTYLGLLVQPIRILSKVASRWQQGMASAERVFEVLDQPVDVEESANPVTPGRLSGRVQFENVCYRYEPDRPVLCGINLDISPGESVAIVGTTGGGKTTLADMILRFFDPQCGRVLVDGTDIRMFDLREYRRQIGMVPQDPILLKGSFSFNISYGAAGTTMDAIKQAAVIAGIDDFIRSLPKGYDTEIGERGVTLSGGQRQRVAIARAIVRDPRILILDEATSSLDAQVESQIQEAMRSAVHGRTSFIIAHRLSTVRDADRIVVMDKGLITEEGTHTQLLAMDGKYAALYNLQGDTV